jgi:hypothetical protein
VESSSELIPPSAGDKSETGKQIRNPHDIPHQSLSALVEQWSEARGRTVLAKHAHVGELLAEDLFAELAYGARIAQETTAGRQPSRAIVFLDGLPGSGQRRQRSHIQRVRGRAPGGCLPRWMPTSRSRIMCVNRCRPRPDRRPDSAPTVRPIHRSGGR